MISLNSRLRHKVGRFLDAKIEVWFFLLIFLIVLMFSWSFSWLVQYRLNGGGQAGAVGDLALAVAQFPDPLVRMLSGQNVLQPQKLRFSDFAGMKIFSNTPVRNDALLVSAFSESDGVSVAYIYDLSDKKIIHKWIPPVAHINAQTSFHDDMNVKKNYRTQHPLLLKDGSIIVSSGEGPLARIDACGNLIWTIDRHFHHSIELSADGTIYVPIVIDSPSHSVVASDRPLVEPTRIDGFAEVSLDGQILREWSLKAIMEQNGYIGLLYGVGQYEEDRFHLNDVQPMMKSDGHVKRGDLALSIRNLSTTLLYRPSTEEIIWSQTGPWLNQHDIDYQGDGIFSVFGNDTVRFSRSHKAHRGYSTIWQYDMNTAKATVLLSLDEIGMFVAFQGVHRMLDNGRIFIEESTRGLMHVVSADGIEWSYVNAIDEGHIGTMHWGRYLSEGEAVFPWLQEITCD